MTTKEEPVFYYYAHLTLPGATQTTKICTQEGDLVPREKGEPPVTAYLGFNKAWGFTDGHCSYVAEDGSFQPLPLVDELGDEYDNSFRDMTRAKELTLLVAVYKDGSKKIARIGGNKIVEVQ